MKSLKYIIFFLITLLIIASCIGPDHSEDHGQSRFSNFSTSNPEIATGFQIKDDGNIKLLEIFHPWDAMHPAYKYYLIKENNKDLNFDDGDKIIVPVKSMVCLSATHLSFVDALDEIDKISGVSSADFVVSSKFQNLVETEKIKEIGIGDHFKLEELIDLAPDLVMVSPKKGQSFEPLLNAGLTIIPNGDYLESHPLGRAEWIKFVGVLTGKEKEAIQIFDSIKNEYNKLKTLTQDVEDKPSIFSGKQYGGFWNMPGGESYVAQFFKDAGVNYLWANNLGVGGITLDFETVYDKALNADYWRFIVYSNSDFTFQMLRNEDERYSNFKAFREKKILVCNTLSKPYFQKGLLEPQIILADYIHIFYPELLPDHQNVYYELMK